MKKLTRLAAALFVAACTSGIPVQAQTVGEDFTDHILNPGFESLNNLTMPNPPGGGKMILPESWIFTYDIPGWCDIWAGPTNDVNAPSAEGEQYFNCWSSNLNSMDLWQKIKLPAGAYELSTMMRMTNGMDMLSNQHIYVKAGDEIIESSILSQKGVGREWERLSLIFETNGEDSVIIGASSLSDTKNSRGWFQLDDVSIVYFGKDLNEATVYSLQNELSQMNQEISDLTSSDWLTSGSEQLIYDASDVYDEYGEFTDVDKLNFAVDSLKRIKTEILLCEELGISLSELIDEENMLTSSSNPFPGAKDLQNAIDVAIGYMGTGGVTPEGNKVYSEDMKRAIEDLLMADRAYRLTEPFSADKPADYSWMIKAANFTKKGGDPSVLADAISTGWATNNVLVSGDCRLNMINGKNCWNNWSNNFTSMDVYQELTGLPEGTYSIECKTTADAPVTTNHAYAKSTAGITVSPTATYWYDAAVEGGIAAEKAEWEMLQTGKIFVGDDGKLRIGFASTYGGQSSEGWFCITDYVLKYYGPDANGYENSLDEKIKVAESLCDTVMLKADMTQLKSAIEVGKAAKGEDVVTINAAFETLNKAIDLVPVSYKALKSYIQNELAVAQGLDTVLVNGSSKELTKKMIAMQNAVLESDTTTYKAVSELKMILAAFNAYVKIYDEALTCVAQTDIFETENIQKLNEVVVAQAQIIGKGTTKDVIDALAVECRSAITELKLTEKPGEHTDFSFMIVNPDVNTPNNDTCPTGWKVDKINGGTYAGSGYSSTGNPKDYYLDSWGGEGQLRYTARQVVFGIPNGTYRLTAIGRASGEGAFIFAVAKDTLTMEIPKMDDAGGNVWANAPADSDEQLVNDGKGYGWSYVTVDSIVVWNNCMEIGCTTDSEFSHKSWTGWWFSADKFKLSYLSTDWNVGVEDVQANGSETRLVAYAENGYIVVVDEESYTITTLAGTPVSITGQCVPGIYIVKAGIRTTKVMVK